MYTEIYYYKLKINELIEGNGWIQKLKYNTYRDKFGHPAQTLNIFIELKSSFLHEKKKCE